MNRERKKIVHILYSGLGGHSAVFFSLVRGDKQKELNNIAFFCGVEELNPGIAAVCKNELIDYKVFIKRKGIDFASYRAIASALIKEKPDAIFLHSIGYILPVILYKILHPFKRIVLRDTQAAHLKTKTEWRLLLLSFWVANKTVFLTDEALNSFKQHFPFWFRSGKTCVIANGIDTEKYKPVPSKNNPALLIGMQSRLQRIKDHPTLINAFHKILQQFPGTNIQLIIAGDGDTMNELKQLVQNEGLQNKIIFTGMIDEESLIVLLGDINIYVHATFGETMSNSIIQAMACGLPIIASDVEGVNNMVSDEQTGLLYESQNVNMLAEKIALLINNPQLRQHLGANARNEVLVKYAAENNFIKYKNVLLPA